MKRRIVISVIMLVTGHLMTELSEVIEHFSPGVSSVTWWPLLYDGPGWYDERGINALWWVKFNTDELLWCLTFGAMVVGSRGYSRRLYIVGWLFLGYHLLDWVMLWWDYKQSHFMYWVLCADMIAAGIVLVKVRDTKVKSMI